ncbi:DUF3055 domain-containing protein [Salinicoccus sp. ID82-1]|uniref:DUF3055 domain-containing protein n=1 Tax=Salinicoccus cyprini TaxID=2493691 RepID=A0A558AWV0_9STAP|nr:MULTISPECIES: DUF3055 domain-containing protein [Salinicoccus]MCG1010104.1 DUF3055 domain-containing protein [Salinicoccus sp. ID82-1]TVT28734.1 DUF3055 domain-containing protein [Salinicoccus cyprini]
MIDFFLYDESEDTNTRYVSFVGEHARYDLAIIQTDRYFGKSLVLNTQSSRFGIIGSDDLEEEGYIAHILGLSDEEAAEVEAFLSEIIV